MAKGTKRLYGLIGDIDALTSKLCCKKSNFLEQCRNLTSYYVSVLNIYIIVFQQGKASPLFFFSPLLMITKRAFIQYFFSAFYSYRGVFVATWSSILGCSPIQDRSSLYIMIICVVCQGFQSANVKTQILRRGNFLRLQC